MKPLGQFATDVRADMSLPDTGAPFNSKNWKNANIAYRDELIALPGKDFLRRHVFEAFQHSTHKGVTYAIIWGYPRGKTYGGSKNNAPNLVDALNDLSALVSKVDSMIAYQTSALATIVSLNEQPGINVSTSSKIAYFSQLQTSAGPCLILDSQVTTAILALDYPELNCMRAAFKTSLIQAPSKEQINKAFRKVERYPLYVELAHRLAASIGSDVEGPDVERFLFRAGRNVALRKPVLRSGAPAASA